jgi:ubiquitin carboxyl-terminal hydrolase 5/13
MGFPLVRCQKALLATGNSDPEAAMEWLFIHMEDPGAYHFLLTDNLLTQSSDIDTPIPTSAASGPEPSLEQISMLADMGFTPAQARKALKETVTPHLRLPYGTALNSTFAGRQPRARRRMAVQPPGRRRRS